MADELKLSVGYDNEGEAQAAAEALRNEGAEAAVSAPDPGVFPLPFLLALVIPPGLALLGKVISDTVIRHNRAGVIIDASGEGVQITHDKEMEGGTVIVITGSDEESKRTDIPAADLAAYIEAALKAVAGGSTATQAAAAASNAIGDGTASAGGSTPPDGGS